MKFIIIDHPSNFFTVLFWSVFFSTSFSSFFTNTIPRFFTKRGIPRNAKGAHGASISGGMSPLRKSISLEQRVSRSFVQLEVKAPVRGMRGTFEKKEWKKAPRHYHCHHCCPSPSESRTIECSVVIRTI